MNITSKLNNLPLRSVSTPAVKESSGDCKGCSASQASSAAASDQASISFNSPLSPKAEVLMMATASEAAKLDSSGELGEYEPGEVIVRTKPGTTLSSDKGSLVDDFGAKVLHEFDTPGGIHKSETGEFLHLKLPAGVTVAEAMAAMSKDERVTFVEPNNVYTLPEVVEGETPQTQGEGISNDPKASKLYGLHNEGQTRGTADADIDAPEAWQVHTGRDQADGGTLIAVIDTGIDYNHPDLKDNMWKNPGEIAGNGIDDDNNGVVDDVYGYNAYSDNGDPMDGHSHGTHCAGTIGAQGNNGEGVIGVNHDANLMAVKIFSDSGRTTTRAIISGIQYADKMGARITSNSWGGTRANQGIRAAFEDSSALHFAAAGNSNVDNDRKPHYPSSYELPNMIAVGATDHNDRRASFSCYGETSVDIGAPGKDILSTVNGGGYKSYSGTSMATPHAAGVGVLVADANPGISNEELRARILDTADPVESLQGLWVTGGRLNAAAAIQPAENDQLPPALPKDFRAKSVSHDMVSLGWTATGDDGWCGDAAGYDVRVSSQPIVDGEAAEGQVSFAGATKLETGKAKTVGELESLNYAVEANGEAQKLYFAIKVLDDSGNASSMGAIGVDVPAPPVQEGP